MLSTDVEVLETAIKDQMIVVFDAEIPDSSPSGVYVGQQDDRNEQSPFEAQVAFLQDGYVRQDNGFNFFTFELTLRSILAEQTEEQVFTNLLRKAHFAFRQYFHGIPDNLNAVVDLQIDSIVVGSLSKFAILGASVYRKGDGNTVRREAKFTMTIRSFD